MPFDLNGIFQRLFSWRQDRDNGIAIDADRMDDEMDGMAQALTDIVQGNQPFKGEIKAQDGSVTAPGYAFENATNTGIWRSTANEVHVSVGGQDIATFGASGVTFSQALTAPDITVNGKKPLYGDENATISGQWTFSGQATFQAQVHVNYAQPEVRITDTSTGHSGRVLSAGGRTVIQSSSSDGTADGGGEIALAGRNNADLNRVVVRNGGADREVWHDGNVSGRVQTAHLQDGAVTPAKADQTSTNWTFEQNVKLHSSNASFWLRNDGSNFYLLMTDAGNPGGSWNAKRPMVINLSDGAVRLCDNNELCYVNGSLAWHDGNFASRISALTENTSPAGTEMVACDDGKKVSLQNIASLATGGGIIWDSGWLTAQTSSAPYMYSATYPNSGVIPVGYCIAKCVVSDLGYPVGYIMFLNATSDYYEPNMFGFDPSTREISYRLWHSSVLISVPYHDGSNWGGLTVSSWQLRFLVTHEIPV